MREVLAEIGAQHVPEIVVINKADAADPECLAPAAAPRAALDRRQRPHRRRASTSCSRSIEHDLPHAAVEVDVVVPYDRGDLVARAHRDGELDVVEHSETGTRLVGRVNEQLASELAPLLGVTRHAR